jgi:hypothetical protein
MVDMINESYAGVLAANTVKDSRTTIFLKWSFTIAISILVALLTVWLI